MAGPPRRWMAPSTPPPPSSEEFAALTMASALCRVMSPCDQRDRGHDCLQPPPYGLRRVVPRHAVDAGARRGGRGADEDGRVRGAVREEGELGAQEELEAGGGAGGDVAAHVVGVAGGEFGRARRRAGEDAVAEAGREPLQLALDRVREVPGPAVRDVPVRPEDLLALGRPGGVDDAGLHGDQERRVGRPALARGRAQGGADLRAARADLHGPGACAPPSPSTARGRPARSRS